MTPQEIYDKNLWWVLQEIKKEVLMQDYDGLIVIKIDFTKSINKTSPSLEDVKHILRNQLEKKLKILEIVEKYSSDWNHAHRFVLEIDREKFDSFYKQQKQIALSYKQQKVLRYKFIKLDLVKGKIQYRKDPPIDIQPDNREIKFLIILSREKEIIHENKDIANELGISSGWASNKDLAREIGYIRRDLIKWLISIVKIPEKQARNMIINKKNLGYKLAD